MAIQDATALGDDLLKIGKGQIGKGQIGKGQIGKGRETQMIRHMRHGSPPRLLALQSILSPNRRESLPTPSAGVRMSYRPRKSACARPAADPPQRRGSPTPAVREQ